MQALREVGGSQLQEEAARALLEDEDGLGGRPQARAAYLAIWIVVASCRYARSASTPTTEELYMMWLPVLRHGFGRPFESHEDVSERHGL